MLGLKNTDWLIVLHHDEEGDDDDGSDEEEPFFTSQFCSEAMDTY